MQRLKGVFEMSFVDNIVNTTKNVAVTAGKKTGDAIGISKLKVKNTQINIDIKSKNEKLGALVYDMAKTGEKDTEAFDALVAEIDAAKAELEENNKQLDELRGKVTCTACGVKTDNDNSYCPKCGAKLPEKPVQPEEPVVEES